MDREAAHREDRARRSGEADGTADVVSGSRPPNARSAPERPSASVKNSSIAVRSAVYMLAQIKRRIGWKQAL